MSGTDAPGILVGYTRYYRCVFMKFTVSRIPGVRVIDLELREDDRGFFARTWCEQEFAAQGLNTHWPQGNLTRTLARGMIRGMHWQAEPSPEIKLVRCSRGAIWDVLVDVRKESPAYGTWETFELTAENHRQLYVPAGVAHGFQCLEEGSEVSYLMGALYVPGLARGLRWNDPKVGIQWPIPNPQLSPRDRELPLLDMI